MFSVSVIDNHAALDQYHARYDNVTYRAIREEFDAEYLFDSPANPDHHPVTDVMNLVTDAALWRCGHTDRTGTCDIQLSQAESAIPAFIKDLAPLRFADIQAAVDAHLANFPTRDAFSVPGKAAVLSENTSLEPMKPSSTAQDDLMFACRSFATGVVGDLISEYLLDIDPVENTADLSFAVQLVANRLAKAISDSKFHDVHFGYVTGNAA